MSKNLLEISKDANPNYLCKVFTIHELRKHSNADRLQVLTIDHQNVITGLDAKEGDVYVYFPVESKINKDFLAYTNSFRDKSLNNDNTKSGFFEENCRVKAMRLRGEKSMGYIVPFKTVLKALVSVTELPNNMELYSGTEFDTINGVKLVEKYVLPKRKSSESSKQGKKPKLSRLLDGQVHLHANTEHLVKNIQKLNLDDTISITYKTHGTSWWVSNVLVKRPLSWLERLSKKLGVKVDETEYDYVYGSRRVVKNKEFGDPKGKDHYFGYDLWKDVRDRLHGMIPKGYTLYGELLGYDANGKFIQKGYDYGMKVPESQIEVYRITHTTPDGLVTELTYPEIEEFCKKVGLTPSYLFFHGEIYELIGYLRKRGYTIESEDNWRRDLIEALRSEYNEKDCFICDNKVPEEGIVIRKESLFNFNAYKLKSFRFLEWETDQLDKGESDVESEN